MVSGLVGDIIDQVSTAFTNGASAGNPPPPTTAAPTVSAPSTTYTNIRPQQSGNQATTTPPPPAPAPVNPMQMLAGLMGQRPAGGVTSGGLDLGTLISRVVVSYLHSHSSYSGLSD